ncbi:MAG: glycosyltransferase family 39 protein, partial [Chloroflexota bacterium]
MVPSNTAAAPPKRARLAGSWQLRSLVLLLVAAFGLRVMRLEVQSIWVDEGFSVDFASRTAADMTAMWKARGGVGVIDNTTARQAANDPLAIAVDIHPPLYYFALHEWMPWAGRGEYAVRFPSVIAGLLLVLVLFKLGQALAGPTLGLVAAGVGAVAPYDIAYSQEARMYAQVALFAALSLYFTWLILRSRLRLQVWPQSHKQRSTNPRGGHLDSSQRCWATPLGRRGMFPAKLLGPPTGFWLWVGLVVSGGLALYTHYSAVLAILAENAMVAGVALWLLRRGDGKGFRRLAVPWAISQAIEALLFVPWLRTTIGQIAQYDQNLWTPNW